MGVSWYQGCLRELCWQRDGCATVPVPGSPSHQTNKGETEAAFRCSRRADSPAQEGPRAQARGQRRPWQDSPFSITPSTRDREGSAAGGPASRAVCSFCRLLPAGTSCPPSCPHRGPCRPPTRRPSVSGHAGASGRAEASAPTAASVRAASPPVPPGTPCPGIYPSTSRGRGRARTRCWTRPRGLSSGSQVRQRPVVRWVPPGMGRCWSPSSPCGGRDGFGVISVPRETGDGWDGDGRDGCGLWWLRTRVVVQLRDGFVLSGQGLPWVVHTLSTLGLKDDWAPPTLGLGDIKMPN